MEYLENRFSQGIRDSVPIGLGYLLPLVWQQLAVGFL